MKNKTVGIVISADSHMEKSFYFLKLRYGIERALEPLNYHIIILKQNISPTNFVSLITNSNIEGLIVIAPPQNHYVFSLLKEHNIPTVFINSRPQNFSWIDLDNYQAISVVTEHLLKIGHKEILFVAGDPYVQNTVDRVRGFKDTVEKYDIKYNPDLTIYCNFYLTEAYEKISKLLRKENIKFTAILCCNDLMAVGAIRALSDNHKKVPEDVAVVGFDDFDFAENFGLTTYRQPFHEMGFIAGNLLIQYILHKSTYIEQIKLLGELVIRNSCGTKKLQLL